MKTTKLTTIIPLVSALTIGTAFAQGNPHQDPVNAVLQTASIQGNPHIGFEVSYQTMSRYSGNPHEGYISQVVRVAATQGNPHAGFKMVPLTIASAE
jgi:hypothetical protein